MPTIRGGSLGSKPIGLKGRWRIPKPCGVWFDGAGTVIHLAGVVRAGRESEFDEGNRQGTANLVAAVKEVAPTTRLVHVSSLAAAGPSPEPEGRAPDDPPAPISAYGRSKLGGETEVAALGQSTWWCILRPPGVYGPRDTDIFEFFKMASRGLAAIPAGERWLTMVYVADVVRAVLAAAAIGGHGEIYHLGEPSPQRLDDIFDQLAAGGAGRVRVIRVPSAIIRAAGAAGSALAAVGLAAIAPDPGQDHGIARVPLDGANCHLSRCTGVGDRDIVRPGRRCHLAVVSIQALGALSLRS